MPTVPGFKLLIISLLILNLACSQAAPVQAAPQAATIFVNASIQDGLAAHWKIDEIGSSTALDFIGSNPAVLINTASQSNTSLPVLSVPDPASLALNGADDYAQVITPTAALALNTSFTVAAWVRRATTGNYDAIYDSGTQANKWWIFIADNGALPVGTKNNRLGFGIRGITETYSTQPIIDTNWHHIAVVKNGNAGSNLSFFVDGAAKGTAAVGSLALPSGSARVGALLDGSLFALFGGNIDDLRLYNRALNAAEVSRLAGGAGCVTDGLTWATAFRELQCGLASATSGQEIWLAGGIYRPGTARTVSFNLVNGVNLLGGFVGNETLPGQRPPFNPNAVLTHLTGDILGNDNPAGFINYADNSLNVVKAGAGVGATLDGLAIQQGNNDVPTGSGAGLLVQAGALGLNLNNVVVSGNTASGNGAGIHNQAPLSLSGVTLSGNRSTSGNGGGLFSSSNITANSLHVLNNTALFGGGLELTSPFNLTGGSFDGNQANTFSGGGIHASADLTLSGVTFNKNRAHFGGGAIESSAGTTLISSSIFSNNNVLTFDGGAIESSSAVNVASSSFISNTAPQNGGAILTNPGQLIVQGSSFSSNQATGSNCFPVCSNGQGGAISAGGGLTVTNTTFTANAARLDGGAIAVTGGSASFSTTSFSGNKSGFPANAGNPGLGKGGAIFSTGTLTLNSMIASSNTARTNGGAVYSAGPLDMFGGSLSTNSAANGGGLYVENGGNLTDTLVETNTATASGGGMFTSSGVANLTGVTFSHNSAGLFGGGARLNAAVIQHATFSGNSAASEGGAFLLISSSEIIDSIFNGNSSDLSGAISMQGTADRSKTLQVFNNLFYDNQCTSQAGAADMRLFDLTITLANNTFARPGVTGQRSVNFFRSNLTSKNNIWNDYLSSLALGQAALGTTIIEDYDLLSNSPLDGTVTAGAHDITADAQFFDPVANNFRLKFTSPAIDSGDKSILPPSILTDLDGLSRFVDAPGIPDTGAGTPTLDRGAYEFRTNLLYAPVVSK